MLKTQMKEELRASQSENSIQFLAINDLVNKKVKWIRGKGLKVGYTRLDSATGGIVIVTYYDAGYSSVIPFDYWYNTLRAESHSSISEGENCYKSWLSARAISERIHQIRQNIFNPMQKSTT